MARLKNETEDTRDRKAISQAASAMGKKGGPARAKSLTATRRSEIAKKAAAARWGKKPAKKKT